MLTRAHSQTVWLQSPQCFHFRSLPPSLLQHWYLPQVCLPQPPRNTWLLLHSTSFLRASKPTAFLPLRERAGSPLHAQRDLLPKATWAHLRRAVTVICGPHSKDLLTPAVCYLPRLLLHFCKSRGDCFYRRHDCGSENSPARGHIAGSKFTPFRSWAELKFGETSQGHAFLWFSLWTEKGRGCF